MSFTYYITIKFDRQRMPFLLKYLASIKDLIFIDKAKIVKEMDDLEYCGRDLNVVFFD